IAHSQMNLFVAIFFLLLSACLCSSIPKTGDPLYRVSGEPLLTEEFVQRYLGIPDNVPRAGTRALRYKKLKKLGFRQPAQTSSEEATTSRIYMEFDFSPYMEAPSIRIHK
uniref:Bone morphogenetic protein 7 n=1 Tax=Haemonchus contortus TaxID=6289 RepID=A0A7I5EBV1_HAECO